MMLGELWAGVARCRLALTCRGKLPARLRFPPCLGPSCRRSLQFADLSSVRCVRAASVLRVLRVPLSLLGVE
jgi:hypothetical protein